jgi:hypothetical protein
MYILNFSHPLTEKQNEQITSLTGLNIDKILEIPVQVVQDAPLVPQVVEIIGRVELDSRQWQTVPLLINLPGYAPVAACIIAEIEGRTGYLPSVLKLRPVEKALVTEYEVSEIINLKALRDEARKRR